ncbi:MAG: hypothetical protein GY847_14370 [Proteobacteria bacterium]|nr:hypothetical protein [Pseudomonadota bacterium]
MMDMVGKTISGMTSKPKPERPLLTITQHGIDRIDSFITECGSGTLQFNFGVMKNELLEYRQLWREQHPEDTDEN